jgi:colanic acid biosynthesis glycosyl transferase WcaI
MVTGFSYYPRWRKRAEDRGRLFRNERWRGVRVLRGYLYVPAVVTTAKRILHELSFTLFAAFNFLRAGRHDAIVVLSPPLLLGLVGVVFSRAWRVPLVVNVQDLQPDAALSLGMVRPSALTRALAALEAFIYRHSARVTTISPGMRQRLLDKGVPPERVVLCYNWIDVASARRRPAAGRFRARHPRTIGKLVIAYAGNVGAKQGLDVLVDLALTMRGDPRVHFFLVGEGADRARLVARVEAERLENLTVLPFLGAEGYRELLVDLDAAFIAQRAGSGNVFFPSKLLGIMAMGKPVLVSADPGTDLFALVREAGCGLVATAGDVPSLGAHVRALLDDRTLGARLGARAQRCVGAYDRRTVLSDFIAMLEQLHGDGEPAPLEAEADRRIARSQ